MTDQPVLLYDLETNGLLDELDRIHCVATRAVYPFLDVETLSGEWDPGFLDLLSHPAGTRVAHNGIGFDDPAILKVTGLTLNPLTIRDTLVLSRLAYPDLKDRDLRNLRKRVRPYHLPKKLIGSHGLAAWGHRLNCHKGDYSGGWDEFNQDMMDYCVQDVVVLEKLWNLLVSKNLPEQAVLLEHAFQHVLVKQMARGVRFDMDASAILGRELTIRIAEIDDTLRSSVLPFTDTWVTPKKKLPRSKEVPFNANSPAHRVRHFKERHGWVPTEFTETGGPKMDAEILEALEFPEAKLLAERAKCAKILGYISTGRLPWEECVDENDRIHGFINHLGTVTSRCSHSRPNLGNIPARGELGVACRKLFIPKQGWVMVGMDASGLELRCLANRLFPYDGGAYAKALLEGDIHTANQEAAGLETRDQAKTFIYAWLYGAGEEKIGKIVGGGKKEGAELKRRFLAKTPGVKQWIKDVKAQANEDGYVVSLDGRKVPVKEDYTAPNYQLQSDGAVIMKQATVLVDEEIYAPGRNTRAYQVLSVHDEVQFECHPKDSEYLEGALRRAMVEAGRVLGVRVPLEGDAKTGRNWSETH